MVNSGKKLLVLDINGLLLDTYFQGEERPDRPHDAKVNRFYVYKRAFCEEFIQFSLQNFIVGVWSSAREHNVLSLVDFMFKEAKEKLAFIWHQQHCTDTGFRHPDNKHKPVFLKELSKLWEKFEADLPWAKGDYGPSNTLLIDDSPYKAISNPRHTAIFPKTYKATDPEDNFLAGELLPYLEGLLNARDVQKYIQRNPIGESSISPSDPQWLEILQSDQFKNEEEPAVPAHLMAIGATMRSNFVVSSHQWMMPNRLLPANGGAVPQLVGAESHAWNTGHREKRWKRFDRLPDGDYHGGTYDSQRHTRDFHERGAGPSWSSRPTSRDTSDDLFRKHALLSKRSNDNAMLSRRPNDNGMLSRRPNDYGDISRESDRFYHPDFHSQKGHDKRSSFRDYGGRASGWSGQPVDFDRYDSRDFHRVGTRDQEGSYQGEGKRKRRGDWTRDPRVEPMDEHPGIRARDLSRDKEFEEPKRRWDWTRDPRALPVDERQVIRKGERSVGRELEEPKGRRDWTRDTRAVAMDEHRWTRELSRGREVEVPYSSSFQRQSSPRHDYRREESQFKSKPREGRDFQRYAEKELPRKRDLSADSGRYSQRYDQTYDGSQNRRRRKNGRNN
ncbi:unnamed protein product [Calypogeia fissa]